MKKKLLKNAYIIISADFPVQKADILISENEILQVFPNGYNEKNFQEIEVWDMSDKLITPGFINSHSHVAMTLFRGVADDMNFKEWFFDNMLPREELLDDESVYYASMLALMEMSAKGITFSADMYFFTNSICKAFSDIGMRGCISRGLSFDDQKGWDRRLDETMDTYNRYNGYKNLLEVGFGPHAPYTVPMERLAEVASLAKKLGASVQMHIYESAWEKESYTFDDLDKTGIFDTKLIAAHCVQVDMHDIKTLAAKNVTVVHNPCSNLKLGNGTAPVIAMLDENVNVTVGTDGAASNNSLDILGEMKIMALSQKSKYSPSQVKINDVLRMAWENGGYAFGKKMGRIEPGYYADLAVFDISKPSFYPIDLQRLKSHIVYSTGSDSVFATMVNGEWIYYNGTYPLIKESDIYEKFQKSFIRIESTFNGNSVIPGN